MRANDAQNREALRRGEGRVAKGVGYGAERAKVGVGGLTKSTSGEGGVFCEGYPTRSGKFGWGVKHEVGKLRKYMCTIFPIVTGLHQLASAKAGEAEALSREFQRGFAEGAEDVEALRVDVGKRVGLLIGAVKADRVQTKKLCQAVVNLQISENWARGAGQEKEGVMQPMHCNQVEDQGKAVQPRTSTVTRRLFVSE